MPGIFGVIDRAAVNSQRGQQELFGLVERMSAAMCYEGGVAEAPVSWPSLGACAGSVALPGHGTVDPTGAGIAALTVGEDGADEATVIEAYRRHGVNGLGELPGMTAGFLADVDGGRCLLFNDRYGRERLFLHVDGTRVAFASEAKAILAIAPATRTFDTAGLAEWLACGCTIGQRSLFRGIDVLDSGTVVTFDGATHHRRRYFDSARLENADPVSGHEFLETFSASLHSAVTAATRKTPSAGMSLTGGLD